MSLRSKLLAGNKQLEASLVDHSAHVVPGATGQQVRLIQIALICIDRIPIDEGEYKARHYGPSTAAAVLAYKKKRKIINQSYQSAEDNIVGKMTIASLDDELFILEQIPLRPGKPALPSFRPDFVPRPTTRIPLISRLALQRAVTDANQGKTA